MSFGSTDRRGARLAFGTRLVWMAALVALLGCGAPPPVLAAEPVDPWPELARDIFNGRPLADGAGVIAIEMPYRAEDAAIVPVTLRATLPRSDSRTVKAITLVIDQNPAPVAATFQVGDGVTMISTRVRVDSYTNVHAVAELSDGSLLRLHGVREGIGRLFRPDGQERRRGQCESRADAVSAIRQSTAKPATVR